jgi:pimeloyl-ACP methyl ester carboxylesterase
MKMRSAKKLPILVFTAIMLSIVLLVAYGRKEQVQSAVPETAQAGDLVGLESCTYKAGDVEYAADCGTLVVPENRKSPDSRLLALPLIRVHATGPNPAEPIFYFQGGPGGTNMRFQHLKDLIGNHDIIQVGYRGVDGSVVLDCPEISEAVRNVPAVLSDEALQSFTAASEQCASRLQYEGVDLAGYTLTETIDDNEDARVALGYDRINLLGESYGTRIEMIYEWMYPDSLHRVIMLAVNPPGHFLWEAEDIDSQIEHYGRLCAQDTECSARTDDLAASMRHVSENMPERWLFIPIDKGSVKLITFVMFMESVQLPGIPISGPAAVDMWLAAAEGDPSGLALATMSRNLFLPNLWTWGEGLSLVASVDDFYDPTRDFLTELDRSDTILGSPFSLFHWSLLSKWPNNFIPAEYLQVQPTDVATLLISGSIDFSTAPQFSTNELLPRLSNGHQVILEDMGHTESFWNSQPQARAHLLNKFFDTGEVDDSQYTYQPLDFNVKLGWPVLAKRLLGIVVAGVILLIAAVSIAL